MLYVTVLDFDNGVVRHHHGEKHEVVEWLQQEFPEECGDLDSLDECVEAMNADGFYQVTVEPMKAGNGNLLPEDFLTHDQSDDPWPRESDALDRDAD